MTRPRIAFLCLSSSDTDSRAVHLTTWMQLMDAGGFDGTIVLGTHNLKKRRELEELLEGGALSIRTLEDFPDAIDVEETGDTFAENAALKASQQALTIGRWVLGEDSGLCVDALEGAPGVYSKRFSGDNATDDSNNRLLLEKIEHVEDAKRTAFYVCHIALANPSGEIVLRCNGACHGILRREPTGTNGFGYDPLFEIPEYHRTFGELGSSVKRVLSHRSRAHAAFIRELNRMTRAR